MPASRTPLLLSIITLLLLAALIHSGIRPYDRTTWLMEVAPVLIALPLLWLTHRRYPLTPLLYTLIFFHALILIFGGMYSYARVPLGFEVQQWLDLGRNPYDKLGHFFQGLVPALVAREILLRGGYVQGRKMLGFVVCCIALAISAVYELIEWWAALALGQGADEFRHPGRPVGYPVRHVLRVARRAMRFAAARRLARPANSPPTLSIFRR